MRRGRQTPGGSPARGCWRSCPAAWLRCFSPLVRSWSPCHQTKAGSARLPESRARGQAPSHGQGGAATSRPVRSRSRPPRRGPCPCSTGRRRVGRLPRSGRVEIRLGPAWVRYRETATPETDPPSTSHRPVLVAGRHRARSSRLRVSLPRCQPSPWCSPAATPTSPTCPARVRLLLTGCRSSAGAARARPEVCSGIRLHALR
jgi:hypothetical protein